VNQSQSLPTVAIFGLGIIGSQAANHITGGGYPSITWSRNPRDRSDYEPDPKEAAEKADIIVCYLKDVEAVREVFHAIKPVLDPAKTFINHATIDYDTTEYLVAECAQMGCAFLNAPFTGSKVAAGNASLVYYAGGDEALITSLQPLLKTTAARIMRVPSPLAATILKLTTNLITASTVQALAEGLSINAAHGIPADIYLSAIQPNACASTLIEMKGPSMARGDYDPHFSLSNMLKDARYMLDLAQRAGLETPGIRNTTDQMQKRNDLGEGESDFSILYRQFIQQ